MDSNKVVVFRESMKFKKQGMKISTIKLETFQLPTSSAGRQKCFITHTILLQTSGSFQYILQHLPTRVRLH